jgi:transcriptional regulator with XRE-family HTH domain
MIMAMKGNHLVREARKRAGLTQRELASRAGTTQSAVARIEAGRTSPTLEHLTRLVRACGFDLYVRLAALDDHDWSLVEENLAMRPAERLAKLIRAVRFAESGREAARAHRGA